MSKKTYRLETIQKAIAECLYHDFDFNIKRYPDGSISYFNTKEIDSFIKSRLDGLEEKNDKVTFYVPTGVGRSLLYNPIVSLKGVNHISAPLQNKLSDLMMEVRSICQESNVDFSGEFRTKGSIIIDGFKGD